MSSDYKKVFHSEGKGQLTVVECKGYSKYCKVVCSICSPDVGLYPEGSFSMKYSNLVKGQYPCGCSCSKLDDRQVNVLVKRINPNLEVLSTFRKNGKRFVKMLCSVCQIRDPELYKIPFEVNMHNILSGRSTGCGCGKNPHYSDEQRLLIANKVCIGRGYLFENFNGKFYKPWTVSCPVCSKDEELYPKGSIRITKSDLEAGKVPCSCNHKKKNFTERQYLVLVNRKCKDLGVVFDGWYGDYRKGSSEVNLSCTETGLTTKFHSLHAFLSLKKRPKFHKEILSETFSTSKGGTLKPISREGDVVDVICSVCHEDFELFPEPFKTDSNKLRSGCHPCACNGKRMWSDYEYRVRIPRKCSELGFTITSIPEERLSASSRVDVVCNKKGHKSKKSLDAIFNAGSGCRMCAEGFYGHYSSREQEKDYLYVIQFKGDYIKVGRSFEPQRRVGELMEDSGITDLKVLHLYTGTHEKVFEFEQYCHDKLEVEGYYHHESEWTIETFHKESYNSILDLVGGESVLEEVSTTNLQTEIEVLKENLQ